GSLALSVCGTTGIRTMLTPLAVISVIVCWMVRPVPDPPLAQNVLPMNCSMGAPRGLTESLASSYRPSSPDQLPQCTGKTWPFGVIRPCALTRNTAGVVLGMATLTVTAAEVAALLATSDARAV